MTNPVNSTPADTNVSAAVARYFVHQALRSRIAAELRPANKAALFDALATVGIVSVVVTFDGYGDSGQIESIDACDASSEVALPAAMIELASPTYDGESIDRRSLSVAEAIEQLAYDLLEETHAGWENNDGAFGDFIFDVATRTISLDHNDRYTAIESYTHEW